VPISRDFILEYLGSTPNLVGSSLGLGALAVTASTGLTGNLWPATVAVAYGVGVAVARLARPGGEGHHHGQPPPIARRAAR
jgi:hypothetical protein